MRSASEEVKTKEIHLVLTEHEANVLLALTSKVGGATNGPRGVVSTLADALGAELGYDYQKAKEKVPGYLTGEILFSAVGDAEDW